MSKSERQFFSLQVAIKLKSVLQIVQFAQIDNGTILESVNLKRHFFILQIVLKLKTGL